MKLAVIAVRHRDFIEAELLLKESYVRAQSIQDKRALALIRRTYAQLYALRNDIPAARASLAEAIDLFERLGMRRELTEARDDLAQFGAATAPSNDG